MIIDSEPASLQLRSYGSGDEHDIRDLFRTVVGREMSSSDWEWRYVHGPAGAATIMLAWDGPRLVGHYALLPIELEASGQRTRSGQAVDIMTHPDYRGMGVFPCLSRAVRAPAQEDGIEFVWGFWHGDSQRGFREALGWRDLTQIPTISVRPVDVESMPTPHPVRLAEGIDARYDDLWARVAPTQRTVVRRSADYVRWRFIDNPRDAYEVFEHVDGGQLSGYVAIKRRQNQMQIVDLVFGKLEVGVNLCATALQIARSRGVESIALWLDLESPLLHQLEAWGFQLTTPYTCLAGQQLDSPPSSPVASNKWYPAMSDSDVY